MCLNTSLINSLLIFFVNKWTQIIMYVINPFGRKKSGKFTKMFDESVLVVVYSEQKQNNC